MRQPSIIALIPARSGSERVPGKNVRQLAGRPLLAYAVGSALESGIFERVIVSTDSPEYARMARDFGAQTPFLRPKEYAGATSPDIEWVRHALLALGESGDTFDCFSILRPTSPFRTAETIRRAWREFLSGQAADSLRAVEKCRQHPGKMWTVAGNRMTPLLDQPPGQTPWHSSQYQSLPEVHVQNASLEMAWTRVPLETGTIAGDTVIPFLTSGREGFDINNEDDWVLAEHIMASSQAHAHPSAPVRAAS